MSANGRLYVCLSILGDKANRRTEGKVNPTIPKEGDPDPPPPLKSLF